MRSPELSTITDSISLRVKSEVLELPVWTYRKVLLSPSRAHAAP